MTMSMTQTAIDDLINDLEETDEKFVIYRIYEEIKYIQTRIENLSKIITNNYSSEEVERMMSKSLKR